MINKALIFIALVIFPVSIFAQYTISSSVFDKTNGGAMEAVGVRLLNAADSSYVNGAQTDGKGEFFLEKVPNGKYIVQISFVGYISQTVNVTVAGKNITLPSFHLSENSHLLNEVVVKGTAAQMTVRGDTMEYNASAFKTSENAVTEDLLKKMPGMEVTSDGKITVNGEQITKIRVDGKKFFSKCGNSAFLGKEFKGLPVLTILDGKIVFERKFGNAK